MLRIEGVVLGVREDGGRHAALRGERGGAGGEGDAVRDGAHGGAQAAAGAEVGGRRPPGNRAHVGMTRA